MNEEILIAKIKEEYTMETKQLIRKRLREFKEVRNRRTEAIFRELCFCLLTANFQAERSILIQQKINDGFLTFSEEELSKKLRVLGHRFPNKRAEYIVLARTKFDDIINTVFADSSAYEKRDWLVKNIKGLGMKEASHFLRNIGFENLAIIDFHIIDILVRHNVISRPKSLSRKCYLEIEQRLQAIGAQVGLSLAALDLVLWKMETGKILK